MSERRAVFVCERRAPQNFILYSGHFFENLCKISTTKGVQKSPSEVTYTFEKSETRINEKNKTHFTSPA